MPLESPPNPLPLTAPRGSPTPILADPSSGPWARCLHGLYDGLWLLAALLGAPWWGWRALREPAFRRLLEQRAGRSPVSFSGDRPRVLIHGVSVGEVKGAASLVRRLALERPDLEVVLCTITDTGLAVARQHYPDCTVLRLPFDHSRLVRRFLQQVRPLAIVLIELEVWPNFLREANRLGIPVAVVNGRITNHSFGRYRLLERLCPQFRRISLFCAQNSEYAARFAGLGVAADRLCITGNVKVDGIRVGRATPSAELIRLLGGRPGQRVWVAGSTHAPEERYLVEAWARSVPDSRLILVPRHPRRAAEVVAELLGLGQTVQRLSLLRSGEQSPDPSVPVVVDTIGELEQVYGLSELVFIGGSLVPHGGQNLLEPAAQGLPVLHGPHMGNFLQEVLLLREATAAEEVSSPSELGPAVAGLLADPARAQSMGARGQVAVAGQQGATEATWKALLAHGLLRPPGGSRA